MNGKTKTSPAASGGRSALDRLKERGASAPVPPSGTMEIDIPLAKLVFDPKQPRSSLHAIDGELPKDMIEYIQELSVSLDKNGQIQAISVCELSGDRYLVLIGECRSRAMMLLGRKTIRAVIRNDIVSPGEKLLLQLAENVNRNDLSDFEMSASIQKLKNGDDEIPPMKQVAIAQHLGKTEGWVTRYLAFGDEDVQRIWVKPGIVDSVEHAYRVSRLPEPSKLEILRRIKLNPDDLDYLETPLRRATVEQLKEASKVPLVSPPASLASIDTSPGAIGPSTHILDTGGSIGQAIAEPNTIPGGAQQPEAGEKVEQLTRDLKEGISDIGGYKLAEGDLAAIRNVAPPSASMAGDSDVSNTSKVVVPVLCRVKVAHLVELISGMTDDALLSSSIRSLVVEVSIPEPVAKLVANRLAGHIVGDTQLAATLQRKLTELE